MLGSYPVTANVPTTDVDRAAKFYTDVLGLNESRRMGDEVVFYDCGNGTTLEVFRTRGSVASGHTEAGWLVDDIDAVVSGLRDAGVEFEEYDSGEGMTTVNGIATSEMGKAAWFKDPDGNVLGLFQRGGS